MKMIKLLSHPFSKNLTPPFFQRVTFGNRIRQMSLHLPCTEISTFPVQYIACKCSHIYPIIQLCI